jgi:putative transposase
MTRIEWIEVSSSIPLARQCALAGVARSTVYARQRPVKVVTEAVDGDVDIELCHQLDEIYTHYPFYGSRRMVVELSRRGYTVNRKRVQRLMRGMGLAGMAPGPMTSRSHPQHTIYPYRLRGGIDPTPESGMECRCHLYPPAWGLCVSGRRDRLV